MAVDTGDWIKTGTRTIGREEAVVFMTSEGKTKTVVEKDSTFVLTGRTVPSIRFWRQLTSIGMARSRLWRRNNTRFANSLRDDLLRHFTIDVGEAEIAAGVAVGQLLMIEPEEM